MIRRAREAGQAREGRSRPTAGHAAPLVRAAGPTARVQAGGPGAFGGLGYAKVGRRSPVIFAFGCSVLSTTLASSGYLVPFCHWMPTGGVIATPGAGLGLALGGGWGRRGRGCFWGWWRCSRSGPPPPPAA